MSPDKGAHRALAVALETGIPAEDRGEVPRAARDPLLRRVHPPAPRRLDRVRGRGRPRGQGRAPHGARALISPIDWEEPFGLMMIEAMACGTPVISTRRGAVPEIVEHGRTGVIVDNYRDMEDPGRARARRLARSRRDPAARSRSASRRSTWWRTTSPRTRRRSKQRAPCEAPLAGTTARSSRSRFPRWARSPRSRSTSSSTRRSSATSGGRSSPRSGSPSRSSAARSRSSTSSSTGRRRRWRARRSGRGGDRAAARRAGRLALARIRDRRVGAHRRARGAARLAHGRGRARRRTTP